MSNEVETADHDPVVPTSGCLVLVATPIGNLGDLSDRAKTVLGEAAVICCEDTRRTRALLSAIGADTSPRRLWAVHDHNEQAQIDAVLNLVASGSLVAFVSDAGMPGIADPGSRMVDAAHRIGLPVTIVPGPTAALSALVVSGQPTDRFTFLGFPPRKGKERSTWMEDVAASTATVICFESPLRTAATLADLAAVLGPHRSATMVRELTKVHEEVLRAPLGALAALVADRELRGEVVLVIAGATPVHVVDDDLVDEALWAGLEAGEKLKSVAVAVANQFGLDHRATYDRAVALRAERRSLEGGSRGGN